MFTVARIKLKTRREKRKFILGKSKEEFRFNDRTYQIDQDAVYVAEYFGILKFPTLDYYVENVNPIPYYSEGMKPKTEKDQDVIDRMVKGWFETILVSFKILKYILYASIGAVGVGVLNIVLGSGMV